MSFAGELAQLLPQDLPHRDNVIRKSALHLDMIVEINKVMNLTRITDPREAAIKHVLDSVLPWRLFADALTSSTPAPAPASRASPSPSSSPT